MTTMRNPNGQLLPRLKILRAAENGEHFEDIVQVKPGPDALEVNGSISDTCRDTMEDDRVPVFLGFECRTFVITGEPEERVNSHPDLLVLVQKKLSLGPTTSRSAWSVIGLLADCQKRCSLLAWKSVGICQLRQSPINEEALFNHPDLNGIKDYEAMQEGENNSDMASPLLVVRHADIPALDIEAYIDLMASKLTQHFAPDQEKPQQPVAEAAKNPVKDPKAKWAETDAEWDTEQW
ncbi:hypothetical protein DFH07DRAFT_783388 [Mycena maculata]|uniref:Uncharacterized protein n=1 Tax=Mycena maculata TaxID=230809 RepID=A0AAD7HMQ0_9AGAR|nr:hypothetical protein DFH07DRAFT_783388 [Mycena maculata]